MIVGWTRKDDGWYVTVRLCTANLIHLAPKELHYGEKPGWVHWPKVDVPLTDDEIELFADWANFSAECYVQIDKLKEQMEQKKRKLHDAILTRISK